MLHARIRLSSWKISRFSWESPFNLLDFRRVSKRLQSTFSLETARQTVESAEPGQLNKLWDELSAQDRGKALSLRTTFYSRLRTNGLKSPDSYWALAIHNSIPPRITRYADYLFVLELLAEQKQWRSLGELLVDVAGKLPSMWEQLFLQMLSNTGSEVPAQINLTILSLSCLRMRVDLTQLGRSQNSPIVDIAQLMLSKYETQHIISALEFIAATNSVQAPVLASGLLRAISESIVDAEVPPTLLELAGKAEKDFSNNRSDLPSQLWAWKSGREATTSDDLKVYMMFLIYKRQPKFALDLYDKMPHLHTSSLNEAVLLSASALGDFERLQLEFEKVERNPSLIQELGSRRYKIVLEALGFVGNAAILEDIYRNMSTWHADLRTRGVYHALIYSHGLRGDLESSLKVYEMMTNANIEPTMSTFSLILKAYRDSLDLPGFLAFLGNEVIAKHQFPLRNQELSTALSLCSKRRDYKSAEIIWEWGRSLITPDRQSWNAYLHCFVVSNQFDRVWDIFSEIEKLNFVRIDTLTSIMGAACRYSKTNDYIRRVLDKKNQLQLEGDGVWYLSYLSVLAELGDLLGFEATFAEMKGCGVSPQASHYAIYSELLTKTKNFSKHQQLSKEMKDRRVPINFAFIEKHLHLLSAPGTSIESRKAAEEAAFALVKEGYFDPWATMVPRGAIPVRVIEPVVRRLLKTKQHMTARRLLDGLHKQRSTESYVPDDYMLWALYMEVACASKNIHVVSALWPKFVKALEFIFVLEKPGIYGEHSAKDSESAEDDASNKGKSMSSPPEFAVPRRYRFNFSKHIDIRIRQLVAERGPTELLALPTELAQLGLSMDNHNLNVYIRGLVTVGESTAAFETTLRAQKTRYFKLAASTSVSLVEGSDSVKLSDYGKLGEYIRRRKSYQNR